MRSTAVRISPDSASECHRIPRPNVTGFRVRMSSDSASECHRIPQYQGTLQRTVDTADDILVRYRTNEMILLLDEVGKIPAFRYPMMLKTIDKVEVTTAGKLSFLFQSGIRVTV